MERNVYFFSFSIHSDTNQSKMFKNSFSLISRVFSPTFRKTREIRHLFTFHNMTTNENTKISEEPEHPLLSGDIQDNAVDNFEIVVEPSEELVELVKNP